MSKQLPEFHLLDEDEEYEKKLADARSALHFSFYKFRKKMEELNIPEIQMEIAADHTCTTKDDDDDDCVNKLGKKKKVYNNPKKRACPDPDYMDIAIADHTTKENPPASLDRPLLLASAEMLSAIISTHKNWLSR